MTPFAHKSAKSGTLYYLHATTGVNGAGKPVTLYYFAKEINEAKALAAVPETHEVYETPRTGLPILRRKK